ncbi:MAG: transporter substrate-binding domain-containing protein, partial [Campylobacterota bacterium]|nr:transporter substrate-binding domain-containing protein [Campylobacterota bacterium]
MRYILFIFLLLSSLYASKQDSLYTQEEQKWLNQNPLIKIAVMEYWPSDSNGESFHTSLLKLLNRYGGLNLVAAKYDKWSEGFADASKGRELHGIMGIVKNPQRDRDYFDFTKPYEYIPIYIVVKQEDKTIRSLENLHNTTLYIKQNSITATMLKEKVPSATLLGLSSIEAMYQSLSSSDKVQAIVAQFIDEKALDKYRLKIAKVIYNRYGELSMGIHHNYPLLHSIITKTFAKIPAHELSSLRDKKWDATATKVRGSITAKSKEKKELFSADEKAWIQANPTIKVAMMNFKQSDKNNNNIHTDLLTLLSQYSGLHFMPARFDTWKDGFSEASKGESIHAIANLSWSQERQNRHFYYTQPYHFSPYYIIVKKSNHDIHALEDLKEKTIYLKTQSITHKIIQDIKLSKFIDVVDDRSMIERLANSDEVDAIVTFSLNEQLLNKYGLKVAKKIFGKYSELSLGVSHQHKPLQSIINKIYTQIPSTKLTQLQNRVYKSNTKQSHIALNEAQKMWLNKYNNKITMCVDPNWMPFEQIDKYGNYVGMGAQYMQLFSKRLGYPIELVATKSWSESLSYIKKKKCDLLPLAMQTDERKSYLDFTTPYLSFPFVIATGKEQLYIEKIEDVIEHSLGVVKNYAYIDVLKAKYPNIKLVEVESVKDGLERVNRGEIFGYMDAVAPIAHEIQNSHFSNLKISGRTGEVSAWSVGIRKDSKPLLSIMQKLVDGLSQSDHKSIQSKWMSVKYELGFDYTLLWKILSVVGVMMILFIYWTRKLSREIAHRKKIEAQLKVAKEKAEAATEAKSIFLARMSHEIRTPMNAVLGMLYLTQKTSLTPIQENYIEKAHSAADSLLGVINDILDFSKIEAGKLDIELVEFDFHEMMSKVGSIMSFKMQDKNLELLITYDEAIPDYLISDPTRIEQILINLIGNAIKFTSQGAIVISPKLIQREGAELTLQFCIDDSGIGITQDDQAKLFRDFSQVDNSTTRKFGGTGLGLAISKKLSNMLGGDIWLESSSKEQGSTFCFTIQAKEAKTKTTQEMIFPETLKHLKILIVDDNVVACQILVDMLQSLKIEHITVANSGEEAFVECVQKKHRYDIIFMDYKMQGLNGIESYKRIVAELGSQAPKVIMVSAYSKEDIMRESKAAGIESFLTKPIHPSLLFDTILHTIGKDELISNSHHKKLEDISLASIKGAKVLLVEDNEINQEFAIMLLEGQGIVVEVANDGYEAIEKVQTQEYELVLMDIEMPNLDGLSAAKKIRAMEGEYYQKMPIVALSAHAMKHDIDKSLAAGMNEHITKPINPNELFEVMLRYIEPREDITPSPSEAQSSSHFDDIQSELIDFKAGIARAGGNEEGYIKVLKRVCSKYKEVMKPLRELIENNQLVQAESKMHELKGVSGNIGAMKLFRVLEALDNELKASIAPSPIQLQELEQLLKDTFGEVAKLKLYEQESVSIDFDQSEVIELLEVVGSNLEVNIIDSEEALAKLQPYLQNTPYQESLETIA